MLVREKLDLFPLRQMVSAHGEAQRVFARQGLLDQLSRAERYQIVSHGSGGQIYAASESALAQAQEVLRQAYGDAIRFGGVTVHSYVDEQSDQVMIPILFMRLDAPRAHAKALMGLLAERAITTQEVDMQRDRVVIRAEVPLSRLLGLERLVAALTDGAAHTMSWLLRYGRLAP